VFVSKVPLQSERSERPVGRLDDGTAIYAPIGEMLQDGDRVRCHLCGRWLRMVAGQHLIVRHGMTTEEYCELFHLDVSASTACADTSELKRASMLEQIADAGPGRVYPLTERGAPPTIPRWRSLAVRRPDLMIDWDTDAQDNPDPYTIGEHSDGKVQWRCHSCGRQSPKVRSHGRGCPACGRQRIIEATVQRNQQPPPRERSLGALRPDLLTEWHPTRNQDIDPFAISRGSERKVWWRCGTCQTEWHTAVNDRTRSTPHGCPTCSLARRAAGLTVVSAERSLVTRDPRLLQEWHPTRNGDLDPYTVAASSVRQLWWRCRYCAREWQTSPAARRHSPGGCPTCAQSRGQQRRRRGE
jgi:rubrerythrin